MKKLLLFLFVLLTRTVFAQQCGFDVAHQKLLQTNPVYNQKVQQFNAQWAQQVAMSSSALITTTPTGIIYQIPVVIHVIHTGGSIGSIYNPTDAQLTGMIDYLNQTYAATYSAYPDTNSGGVYFPVKFVLAKRSPACGSTTGINRVDGSGIPNYALKGVNSTHTSGADEVTVKALSKWPNTEYYNIWVVNKIDSNDGTFGTFTAGYAYFPGAGPSLDGCIMLATQAIAGQITLPHEIGHAFSIYHTFEGDNGGGTCPTNSNCATDGDLICDTDPEKRSVFNCPSGTNPCTGTGYNNVQHNFMDYSNCQNRFTAGQRTRWLNALFNLRPGLLSSLGGVNPTTSVAAANCVTTVSNTNNNNDMGPTAVTLNNLTSNSGGYTSEGYLAYVDRSCQQRAVVTAGQSYPLSVTTIINAQKVNVFIDYNNDGVFGSGELVYSHTGSISGTEVHSTTYTPPTSGVTTCTPLRMRVVADFVSSTLPTNGCGTLVYGQAEDFGIIIRPAGSDITLTNTLTSGSNPSCVGSAITFMASPSAALTLPTYIWYVNGAIAGAGTTLTSATITNNSTVLCKVIFTGTCGPDSAFSNTIVALKTTSIAPTITVSANPGNSICSGASVTFSTSITNGGITPTYQWKVNSSSIIGATSSTYNTNTLANGDVVSCVLTSNASCAVPATVTSNLITMTVTGSVTPSVTIAANPGSSICSGTSVTFTATPVGGGGSPTYVWKKNTVTIVGATSSTYTSSALVNGDVISCVMTSSSSCATPASTTSNNITMTVNASVTASVSIAANPGNTICAGTPVTFTAIPTNGGATPGYQWKINGVTISGETNATFITSTLTNGNVVTCVLSTSNSCATPAQTTSNSITMTVNPTVAAFVSIAANPGNVVCTGTSVTFTATPTNGGSTPAYQWKKNGSNILGATSATYISATLTNNDVITCDMSSNTSCPLPITATSNSITMTVSSSLTPTVTIVASPSNIICAGMSVTFTATITNGGITPLYQWKKNGSNILGATSAVYTTNILANGDAITCQLTSSSPCATPTVVASSAINISIAVSLTASVSIAANPGSSVCSGTSLTFTATPTNGGNTPAYQWKKNGVDILGATAVTYVTTTLVNADVITCQMTTSATCATPTITTSTGITMAISAPATPSVSIVANPGTTICTGTSVTFTATPTNGGAGPTYQWQINGVSILGATNTTFVTNSLNNNDVVTCIMISNGVCVSSSPVTSNALTMSVNSVVPSVAISSSAGNTICAGAQPTFIATPTNGGTPPSYQWKKNGVNFATGGSVSVIGLVNGDAINCIMTSTASCAIPTTATSNVITMVVNPIVSPSISITSNTGNAICPGGTVTFTAAITNGGTSQAYQWKRNGVNVGTNSPTFTTNTIGSGNVITCQLTITAACPNPATVTSNGITMTVSSPLISVTVSPNNVICSTTPAVFSISAANVGNNPHYQWVRNSANVVGANYPLYVIPMATTGDVVTAIFTGSDNCVGSPVNSSNSITMSVTPVQIPLVSIMVAPGAAVTEGDPVTFTGVTNISNMQYQWRMNDTNVTGATSSAFTTTTLKNNDKVSLFISSADSCVKPDTAVSNSIVMNVAVGVQKVKELFNDIHLAPNPNNGSFRIHGTVKNGVDTKGATIEVLNALGAVIYKEPLTIQDNMVEAQLDLGDRVSNGLYMVRLNIGGYSQAIRFVTSK